MKTFDKKNVLTSLKGPDEDKIECAVIGRFIPPILLSRLSYSASACPNTIHAFFIVYILQNISWICKMLTSREETRG